MHYSVRSYVEERGESVQYNVSRYAGLIIVKKICKLACDECTYVGEKGESMHDDVRRINVGERTEEMHYTVKR
jgi:hypothetical protein